MPLARIVEPEQLDAVLGGILLDLAHHARELRDWRYPCREPRVGT